MKQQTSKEIDNKKMLYVSAKLYTLLSKPIF
jgi:hypothetical protein